MKVNEIFYSIQGESTYQGRPCAFVRLTGCNLRCRYCDTAYAYEEGEELTVENVLRRLRAYPCRLAEITGGEPLLQEDVYPLMEGLLAEGYEVLLETNGSLKAVRVPRNVVRIIDLKCPDSGESERIYWPNLEELRPTDQIKFVVSSHRDYDWAKDVMECHTLSDCVTVLLSPASGRMSPEELAEWILEDGLDVRLQLQLHKYIWSPKRRGV